MRGAAAWIAAVLIGPLLVGGALADTPAARAACQQAPDCITLPSGTYHVRPPAGWNGQDRLPVLMFLHGYRGDGAGTLADAAIAGPASQQGVLLVAPDGVQGTWSHQGAPRRLRDDIGFLHAVRRDVARRFAVAADRMLIGGFSIGGSMVWDLACQSPRGFSAFLAYSGGFWEPLPARCPGGAVALWHAHGTSDATVPMAGRAIGTHSRQGDILRGFQRWISAGDCAAVADRSDARDGLQCQEWTSCGGHRRLALCLHDAGHSIEPDWLTLGLRWGLAAN